METISKIKNSNQGKMILSALKSASDETRIRILNILSFGSFNVNEITEVLGMGQSRISRHLKILHDAGLLQSQREGTWVYYKLPEDTTANPSFAVDMNRLILAYKEDLPHRETDQQKVAILLRNREEKSTRYFNKVGKNWDRIQEEVLNPDLYRNQILSYLPDKSETILDLGCGPGGLFPYLLKKSKQVIGIDSSEKMLEEARKTYSNQKKIKIVEAPLENLPFKTGTADAVVASMVLHHISNPPLVLNEASRVLKNKGVLCIVDLKKHDKEFMRDAYADLWLGFDPNLLTDWLRAANFELKEIIEQETHSYFKIIAIKAIKKGGQNVRNN
ncbi:MAG TPA: metalloregulator ArsR/SmtB family transcription factor [Leptospiraceae bacterium]|nr:metalloregulator ArsR/SmtB family transcription factor [Leptospiraceae bacterium]HMW06470.1 metalloregulator ArsR/SmtB family transcription factor [Leptospiraceae bacterium]HMX32428.1 metalloregulator ArsR/SmtB family transcription factor [Leptospiraceae bacterium]HMY33671.1 metalloregulator ArsR/SmtB family transcription factor [Leptospiraceae bacterium]HMZ65222.1 metalloregulator ArsR/SmtB family transcription factor [Leptospiraceae bacterium]